jgi:putative oxidoreductase
MASTAAQNYGATLARLSLGVILIAHGLLKVFVFTVPGAVAHFEGIGIPAIFIYLTLFGEFAGGLALLLGAYSRLSAVLSMPILLGAAWVHSGNGWTFSSAGGGWEYPVLLFVLAIIVALLGNGAFALRKLPLVDGLIPQALKG